VLVGTVAFQHNGPLPDDAEVLVRVIDPHPQPRNGGMSSLTPPNQMPLLNQPASATAITAAAASGPEELGEQTIKHPGSSPVAYHIEFRAEDEVLRRGLNIEVRISYDGRVRLFNANQYAVTLDDVKDPHPIEADTMR